MAVPFLRFSNLVGQSLVAEIPVHFTVRDPINGPGQRADVRLGKVDAKRGTRHRIAHRTVADSVWRATPAVVWVAEREHLLIRAINEKTQEVKYFLSNSPSTAVARLLAVAFRRATMEHAFRLGKQEAGWMDDEGRHYTGLNRHLILCLIVPGFVALYTERLRGEKPAGNGRALNHRGAILFRRRRGISEAR